MSIKSLIGLYFDMPGSKIILVLSIIFSIWFKLWLGCLPGGIPLGEEKDIE